MSKNTSTTEIRSRKNREVKRRTRRKVEDDTKDYKSFITSSPLKPKPTSKLNHKGNFQQNQEEKILFSPKYENHEHSPNRENSPNHEHSMLPKKLNFEDDLSDDDDYHYNYLDFIDDDEFDPIKFIASLPPLNTVKNKPKAPLDLKKTNNFKNTLVLDLDETLVHCSTESLPGANLVFPVLFNQVEYQVYAKKRPYLEEFLDEVSKHFEVIIFTASQRVYADKLLDILDPERKRIHHRIFRDSCIEIDGNYLKDLHVVGRNLSNIIIVDNSPQAYGYQVDNGIPIESWFDNGDDDRLLKLIPFLKKLANVDDVRPFIRKKFKLYHLLEEYKRSCK